MYTNVDITPDHTKLLMRDGRPVVLPDKILRYGSKYLPEYLAPAGLLNGSVPDLVSLGGSPVAGKSIEIQQRR